MSTTGVYLCSSCESVPAGHQLADYGQFPSHRELEPVSSHRELERYLQLWWSESWNLSDDNIHEVQSGSPPELTNRVGQYLRAFGDVIKSTAYGVGSRPQGVIAVW